MSVAAFLASSHRFDIVAAVDDVQDIIDALGTILKTSNSPVWTEPVAGTFQSPVDEFGRWFSVQVERIDADTLQLTVADQYGATVRISRIDINVGGDPAVEVYIYSGEYHLWIDVMRDTIENFRSGIIDISPQSQNAWQTRVYCKAHRNSTGSVAHQTTNKMLVNFSNVTDGGYDDYVLPLQTLTTDLAGNNVFTPVYISNAQTVAVQKSIMTGKMYQVLWGPTSLVYGAEVIVPIDSGQTAKFRVSGAPYNTQPKFLVRAD